jgi:hypothetical protein
MKIRARTEGVAQLLGRCPQSLIGQCGQRRRIRFTIADRMQHATRAGAQQVRHDTRDLDVGFFEERLKPVVELHTLRVIWYLRRITVRQSRCSACGNRPVR